MFYRILVCIALSLLLTSCHSGSQSLPGVYAGISRSGVKYSYGNVLKQDLYHDRIMLRSNGTWTRDLSWPAVDTSVEGTYKRKGNTLECSTQDGSIIKYTIGKNGDLSLRAGYWLRKMEEKKEVPAGTYDFSSNNFISGGTGGVSVASSHSQSIYFDGQGKFTQKQSDFIGLGSDNMAGSDAAAAASAGTYKLENGLMTLKYANGSIVNHSFFVSKSENLALIDGEFFFMDSEAEGQRPAVPTATQLLKTIKKKQGGSAIDAIQTITAEYTIDNGIRFVSVQNLTTNSSRMNVYQGDKLIGAEQWDGSSGWTWKAGKRMPLTEAAAQEFKYAFFSSIAALRKEHISSLEKGTVVQTEEGYSIAYDIDGKPFTMMVDKEGKIVAEKRNITGDLFSAQFSDFKIIDKVLFPFLETDTYRGKTLNARYISITVNDPNAMNWIAPEDM